MSQSELRADDEGDVMTATRPRTDHPALLRSVIATMLLALLLFAGATHADAQIAGARFVYELCDPALPGGDPPEIDFHTEKAYAPIQTCALPGGAVGVTQAGQVTEGPGWIDIAVKPTFLGFVESETITGFASNLQPGASASHVFAEGWPADNFGESPRVFFLNAEPLTLGGGGGFTVALTCSGTCEAGGVIGARDIAATEVDPSPPTMGKVEGPLLAGGILRGHQALAATATDLGGGLSVIEALVNGSVAPGGGTPGACAAAVVKNLSYQGLAAYSPSPCPSALSGSWNLNTSEPPFHEGANTVQVCASDFATIGQPNTTCSVVQTVDVNNSCTESPVVGGQNLNAGIQGGGETVTVPAEQPAEVTGELTSNAGDPIPGATICVQTQVQESGTEPQAIATETTDSRGEFSYEVAPGPNRRFLVGYRHDAFQIAKTLDVNSDAKPRIELSKGRVTHGGKVGITGALPGPQAAGRVVVLQASSLHGDRWLTFRRATTGPMGGFRSSYRFGNTTGTTTYRMRAVVPRQSGYPYEPGHSDPKRVKVLEPGVKKSSTKHTHGGRRHEQGSKRSPRPADDGRVCGADHLDRGIRGRDHRPRRCGTGQDRGGAKGRGAQRNGAQR